MCLSRGPGSKHWCAIMYIYVGPLEWLWVKCCSWHLPFRRVLCKATQLSEDVVVDAGNGLKLRPHCPAIC